MSEKGTEVKEYVLAQDNDGHWYVVAADDLWRFEDLIEMGEDPMTYKIDVEQVGGAPTLVKFTGYRID